MEERKAGRAKSSKSYQKAKNRAEEYANDPEKLNGLIENAAKKANGKKGPLGAIWVQLMACLRLFKAYATGAYREIPWLSLVMLVASVVYFVMPVDAIPDVIAGLGLVDDAAILGWTMQTFSADIDAFLDWEKERAAEHLS